MTTVENQYLVGNFAPVSLAIWIDKPCRCR